MNVKITIHFMPWEMDHALLVADKLKQSSYYLKNDDTIFIDSALNLSSKVINWNESKLSKEYFIEKYSTFDKLVGDKFKHNPFIYDGDGLYGHLDLQKNTLQENIDYYMTICPDIDFSPTLLYYMIEFAKSIKTKYFALTPQIFRCWDNTWDLLVNENFMKYDCSKCIDINIHEIRYILNNIEDKNVEVVPLNSFKFAGWFDLYNKAFYEKLSPALSEWSGYGPWDFYSIHVCQLAKSLNVDVNQYLLKNEVIWFYDVGCLKDFVLWANGDGALKSSYLKFLTRNTDKTQQTLDIYKNMHTNLNGWVEYAKKVGIL